MNKKILVLTSILVITIFSGCGMNSGNFNENSLNNILQQEVDAYKANKPNFDGGFAMQILSPKGDFFISSDMKKVDQNTHFRIASVSKTFTAAAIMLLNQKGLLNIDDKITDNIPGSNIPYIPEDSNYNIPYKDDITIRMLLMHRAGIFCLSNNEIPENSYSINKPYLGKNYLEYILEKDPAHTFTFDELVGINAQNQLSFFEPGTAYHYSDTGYSMLGKIIEQVSGKSYTDFITKELLVPNDLANTSVIYSGEDQSLPEPYVDGYVWANGEIAEVTESNMSPHVAEGSIVTTPYDLAKWGQKLFIAEAGIDEKSVNMMKSNIDLGIQVDSNYGLGISYKPDAGYGHSGAHEGYLTYMIYNPETKVTYVMFSNIWDATEGLETIKTQLNFMTNTANKVLEKMGY